MGMGDLIWAAAVGGLCGAIIVLFFWNRSARERANAAREHFVQTLMAVPQHKVEQHCALIMADTSIPFDERTEMIKMYIDCWLEAQERLHGPFAEEAKRRMRISRMYLQAESDTSEIERGETVCALCHQQLRHTEDSNRFGHYEVYVEETDDGAQLLGFVCSECAESQRVQV